MVKERWVAGCGGGFCAFRYGAGAGSRSRSSSAAAAAAAAFTDADADGSVTHGQGYGGEGESKMKEMGLLHCGEGTNYFLMIDFGERSLRLVDCLLARWRPNTAEARKMDLIVAGADRDGWEEDELFRLEAAPKDVAAFWLRYAMADV
jgi:hypothetical protein